MEALEPPEWVAQQTKLSLSTLKAWRATGQGPKFIRVGRQVRYRPSDVEAWLNTQENAGTAA